MSKDWEDRLFELLGDMRYNACKLLTFDSDWIKKNNVSPLEQKGLLYLIQEACRHWHRNVDYITPSIEDIEENEI